MPRVVTPLLTSSFLWGRRQAALEQYGDIERRLHASYASNSESLKARVAAIDAQTDIERFVATHRTGWTRPGPTLYENYYTGPCASPVRYSFRRCPGLIPGGMGWW